MTGQTWYDFISMAAIECVYMLLFWRLQYFTKSLYGTAIPDLISILRHKLAQLPWILYHWAIHKHRLQISFVGRTKFVIILTCTSIQYHKYGVASSICQGSVPAADKPLNYPTHGGNVLLVKAHLMRPNEALMEPLLDQIDRLGW